MTWYFNEAKFPICASFLDEFDCEREECQFSHEEPIFYAKVIIPQEVMKNLNDLINYLKNIGINNSLPLNAFTEDSSVQNGFH